MAAGYKEPTPLDGTGRATVRGTAYALQGQVMKQSGNLPRSGFGSLVLIAVVLGGGAAAFAYTAGWLSPGRLTPERMIAALAPPGGAPLGHRRNHAKGICFTGAFEANGNGVELSRAGSLSAASIRRWAASTSAPQIRTPWMQQRVCGGWDCRSPRRTAKSGGWR